MDQSELADELLDAIASQRDQAIDSKNTWLSTMRNHLAAGDRDEAGRASTQAEHYATAAQALIVTLARCQQIVSDREQTVALVRAFGERA